MSKKNQTITVQGQAVTVVSGGEEDYISLTDIARYKNGDRTDDLIRNWLRNRNTLEFLGIWEQLNNPQFNPVEFDGIRMQAGLNSFTCRRDRRINWQQQIRGAAECRAVVEAQPSHSTSLGSG